MFCKIIILFSFALHISYCDWVSEWMSPVQDQFHSSARKMGDDLKFPDDDDRAEASPDAMETPVVLAGSLASSLSNMAARPGEEFSAANLKLQIESALQTAQNLIEVLKTQISAVYSKEHMLKEAIANGRAGVTAVTVTSSAQSPRTYLVRDGYWTLCNGMVQFPPSEKPPEITMFTQLFSTPRCIGQEVVTQTDPCVFNSLIKYDTVPTRRAVEYREDDYFCLKPSFRNKVEQYMSVPRRVMNDTCLHGSLKSVTEYTSQCGLRVMSEYAYYPHKNSAASALPLEYCTENDGSCKLIVSWHLTNHSVENFEYLKDEYNFKKYFMKPDHYDAENIM